MRVFASTWSRGHRRCPLHNDRWSHASGSRGRRLRPGSFVAGPALSPIAFRARLSHEIAWSASYTWSRALDTASEFDEQPQNPLALHEEWGRFRYDQPDRLVANALFDLPIGDEEDRPPGTTPAWWVRALSNIEV